MPGSVTFVGAGPGAADLITLRGYRALQAADVVLYDSLVDGSVLDGLEADLIFVGKRCGRHCVKQEEINAMLVDQASAGRRVVRLKGGDPAVLARLGEEALALVERGIPFDIVPGVSSATAAPMLAGIPLTHRGVAEGFVVVTAHLRAEAADFAIPDYDARRTLVLMMPVRTAPRWQEQLLATGHPADLPVAFVTAGATDQQEVRLTTVGGAAETAARIEHARPTLVVVGSVVTLRDQLGFSDDSGEKADSKSAGEAA